MREAQCIRILNVLKGRIGNSGWVTLPEIMDPHIASYTRRISDLRQQGHNIECKTEWIDGIRHSWYRLVPKGPKPIGSRQLEMTPLMEAAK
jgi:Helix-turn-helix domain